MISNSLISRDGCVHLSEGRIKTNYRHISGDMFETHAVLCGDVWSFGVGSGRPYLLFRRFPLGWLLFGRWARLPSGLVVFFVFLSVLLTPFPVPLSVGLGGGLGWWGGEKHSQHSGTALPSLWVSIRGTGCGATLPLNRFPLTDLWRLFLPFFLCFFDFL